MGSLLSGRVWWRSLEQAITSSVLLSAFLTALSTAVLQCHPASLKWVSLGFIILAIICLLCFLAANTCPQAGAGRDGMENSQMTSLIIQGLLALATLTTVILALALKCDSLGVQLGVVMVNGILGALAPTLVGWMSIARVAELKLKLNQEDKRLREAKDALSAPESTSFKAVINWAMVTADQQKAAYHLNLAKLPVQLASAAEDLGRASKGSLLDHFNAFGKLAMQVGVITLRTDSAMILLGKCQDRLENLDENSKSAKKEAINVFKKVYYMEKRLKQWSQEVDQIHAEDLEARRENFVNFSHNQIEVEKMAEDLKMHKDNHRRIFAKKRDIEKQLEEKSVTPESDKKLLDELAIVEADLDEVCENLVDSEVAARLIRRRALQSSSVKSNPHKTI